MTERLAEIGAHIDAIRQLGAVVNAMRGIAAARAQHSRGQLAAVDSYAASIAVGIGHALALAPAPAVDGSNKPARQALVLFCAEQGFAGAFSERVLDAASNDLASADLFLVGTRGGAIAAERGVTPGWKHPMPAHALGVPRLADRIVEALYAKLAAGKVDRLDAVFSLSGRADGVRVERRRLFPMNMADFSRSTHNDVPLMNLAPAQLLQDLTAAYVHAQLCKAALHAFAAENEARMEAMTSAGKQIERQLTTLQATQRVVRQEEITAEIIELATGEAASRQGAGKPSSPTNARRLGLA